MDYSRRKKSPDKRRWWSILSRIILIGVLIGFFVGKCKLTTLLLTVDDHEIPEMIDVHSPPPLYGTRDGQVFDGVEMSLEWVGNETFVPLDCPLDEETQRFIYNLSKGYYIDYSLVMGMIQKESAFQSWVVSATNDYGLMQINMMHFGWLHEQFGITNLLDPAQNVRAGLYILRTLFEKYEDPAKVLMAFNMGESGAKALWDIGIYETEYTKTVFAYADVFESQLLANKKNDNGE